MKKIFILSFILPLSFAAIGQSITTNENYILTRTYTAEKGATSIEDVTYYDGLGYPSQSVSVGASSDGAQSIVTPVYYDALRRESRQYLPYAAADNAGKYRPQAIAEQVGFYNSEYGAQANGYSYTESVYEASPLSRVMEAYNVGAEFRVGNGIKSTLDYQTNTEAEVLSFKINRISKNLELSGSYDANTLHKTTATNEDGTSVVTYKDFRDRTVLERTVDNSAGAAVNFDTYYVYDDFGNLCYVLPPTLSEAARSWPKGVVTYDDIAELAYIYKYDGRNRCIEKHLPGAEPVYMVYDKGDRLVTSQDGNQRMHNQWTYTIYDALGRPVRQSLISSIAMVTRETLQSFFNANSAYSPLASIFSEETILSKTSYDEYVYEVEPASEPKREIFTMDRIPVGTNYVDGRSIYWINKCL